MLGIVGVSSARCGLLAMIVAPAVIRLFVWARRGRLSWEPEAELAPPTVARLAVAWFRVD